jgi:hypothetical protein
LQPRRLSTFSTIGLTRSKLACAIEFANSSIDAIARILAEGLRSELGQAVIVENVGGAGGMTGVNRVAKATPDGYQFVLGNVGTHAVNQSLYKKPLYNAATDFEPVALVTDQSLVLTVGKDFPANNLREFIAYAKANQAKMQYGSAGRRVHPPSVRPTQRGDRHQCDDACSLSEQRAGHAGSPSRPDRLPMP